MDDKLQKDIAHIKERIEVEKPSGPWATVELAVLERLVKYVDEKMGIDHANE